MEPIIQMDEKRFGGTEQASGGGTIERHRWCMVQAIEGAPEQGTEAAFIFCTHYKLMQ